MQTVIRILLGAALGAGCGHGALLWAYRMLRTRGREERLSPTAALLLKLGAAIVGGIIGFCTDGLLPMAAALALLTIGITVAVSDGLCRIIPNPTVLAVFSAALARIAASLLHLPGAPGFGLLSSLGGMVFCFAVFFAPGLMGKRVGAGDIKLAAAMGFLLGFGNALLAIVVMGVLMLGYSMAQRKMPLLAFLKTDIPMGPFISAGMMFAWMLPYFSW